MLLLRGTLFKDVTTGAFDPQVLASENAMRF
jgi:hypothetical protein